MFFRLHLLYFYGNPVFDTKINDKASQHQYL